MAEFAKLSGETLETEYFQYPRSVRRQIYNHLSVEQKEHLDPILYARRGILGKENGHLIYSKEVKQARLERLKEKVEFLNERTKLVKAEIKQLEKDLE